MCNAEHFKRDGYAPKQSRAWKVQHIGIRGMWAALKISGYFDSHLLDSCLPSAVVRSQIPVVDAVIGVEPTKRGKK